MPLVADDNEQEKEDDEFFEDHKPSVDMRRIQYQGETLPPGISVSPGIR